MKAVVQASSKAELKNAAAAAYSQTREADDMHRGFSAATFGNIECRAIPCQSRTKTGDWFSYRYYVGGKAVKAGAIEGLYP